MKIKFNISLSILKRSKLIFVLSFICHYANAQTITLTSTPSPVSGTICPGIPNTYSVNTPSGCVPTWSVTNGQMNTGNGQNTMSVTWNDIPGATATLKVDFSALPDQSCKASEATWSALIL